LFHLGLNSTSECSDCVGGMACDVEGLTYPIRPCSAGYYCRQSADSTTPNLGIHSKENSIMMR